MLLPLEAYLQQVVNEHGDMFPRSGFDYFRQYQNIKNWLTDNYYRNANSGLATEGFPYTHHDLGHVDDVIRMAGQILDLQSGGEWRSPLLHPYEIYQLLVAILLHDAGNAQGRKDHPKRATTILNEMGDISGVDAVEKSMIGSIARAHGGKGRAGDGDTIRHEITGPDNQKHSHANFRPRALAGIVRLADELSDNQYRANPEALKRPYKWPESVVHHQYCKAITANADPLQRKIFLNFHVPISILSEKFPHEGKSIFFIDYISERLSKCDLERQYCNRHMRVAYFDSINVSLTLMDEHDIIDVPITLEIKDEGFPANSRSVKDIDARFDGETLARRYAPHSSAAPIAPPQTSATVPQGLKGALSKIFGW